METYARVAVVLHARNLDGSVVCQAADGLPFLLREGQMVHFVPPLLHGPRSAQVESVQQLRNETAAVHFQGVDDAAQAEALSGCYCLVARDALPREEAQADRRTLVGYAVFDQRLGRLGSVARLEGSSAQAVLAISGEAGEVLVPLVDEFVEAVDHDARRVLVCVPESLLGLNA